MSVDMNNRKSTASCLAKAINEGLIKKFGKIPSANIFANQFNLRAYGTKTITRETARKWLLGLAVPEIDKLVVLVEWLDIDVLNLFGQEPKLANHHNGSSNHNEASYSDVLLKQNGSVNHIEHHINNCLSELNDHSKNALYLAAWMLKQLETNNHDIHLCEQLIKDQLKTCSKCNQKMINHD